MTKHIDLYPIGIVEDRYGGTYSGGKWVAIANVELHSIDELMNNIDPSPWGDDMSASDWGDVPPDWAAVGETPDEALQNLYAKFTFEDSK